MFKWLKVWRLRHHIVKHWGWTEARADRYARFIVYGYERE